MRVNREIKARRVRLIGEDGSQLGLYTLEEALKKASEMGLDLVEIAPKADPPVCKAIDYGKYRYQQTKKEKGMKKTSHQQKIKEVKFKPNIDKHDFEIKVRRARDFLEKGYKVKFTCMFRGREIVFVDNGKTLMRSVVEELGDIASPDAEPRMMGRMLSLMMSPGGKEKKQKENKGAQSKVE